MKENYGDDYYEEDSAWGPPPQKYICDICVVEVPCYDTLEKHKRGKDHIKREKDLEERKKKNGFGDQTWADSKKPGVYHGGYEMQVSEREELIALRAEKIRLQAEVQKNMKELKVCSKDHLQIVKKAEECERCHGQGRGRKLSSTDEGFAGDSSFSETGSSSAGSRGTVPFFAKDEKKEAVNGEYWEEEDEKMKEEYGENTRWRRKGEKNGGGGSLWVGELKDEFGENQEVEQKVKQERTDVPGWGSAFRNPGAGSRK